MYGVNQYRSIQTHKQPRHILDRVHVNDWLHMYMHGGMKLTFLYLDIHCFRNVITVSIYYVWLWSKCFIFMMLPWNLAKIHELRDNLHIHMLTYMPKYIYLNGYWIEFYEIVVSAVSYIYTKVVKSLDLFIKDLLQQKSIRSDFLY
jgi:hypothetical protein